MRVLLLLAFLAVPALAQSKGEMLGKYLAECNGNPNRRPAQLIDLGGSLVSLASNAGWGDAQGLK